MINSYIENHFVEDNGLRNDIAEVLSLCGVPANSVSPATGKMLYLLVRISQAKKILEIGSLAGYSTYWLAKGLTGSGEIISLEIMDSLTKLAIENLKRFSLDHLVKFRVGKASESLEALKKEKEKFDFFFIDADKEEYIDYLNYAIELAQPNALIAVDNALWRGRIFNENDSSPDIEAIRKFNLYVANHEKLESLLLNVGDGLVLARVSNKQ